MVRIVFLILNYNNMEETQKCIDSITQTKVLNWEAVIVDNGSTDDSYKKMETLYDDKKNIHLIQSKYNLGFSNGNNLGYKYVRDNLDADFLIVTNNDVLFPQNDLDVRIKKIYEQYKFHVLGPDIYVRANNVHQSPMMLSFPSLESLKKELSMYEHYLNHPERWVVRRRLQDIKNKFYQSNSIVKKVYDYLRKKESINYSKISHNCCIQGACIILSKEFLNSEEELFSPATFLYCEEILLYHKCLKKNYNIQYNPSVQVWHEDSSTMKKINSDNLSKAKFTLTHHVAARRILLENVYEYK
ncbi:glycosyltransferase family 2 protein [Enterococcus casseliflavus]|uniref:glycosyltransferase family 2 protein n=1 Tax=Enterococcus casseliflavus TaxID=37734 RepID=UPI0035E1A2DF